MKERENISKDWSLECSRFIADASNKIGNWEGMVDEAEGKPRECGILKVKWKKHFKKEKVFNFIKWSTLSKDPLCQTG